MTEFDFSQALSTITGFLKANPWIWIATICIWLAMRVIQSDVKVIPTVPAKFRIFCLPIFTIIAMGGARYQAHASWVTAFLGSVLAAFMSIYFHEAIVNSLRGGKAIPLPGLTIPGAQPSPGAPVTKPVEPPPPSPPPAV